MNIDINISRAPYSLLHSNGHSSLFDTRVWDDCCSEHPRGTRFCQHARDALPAVASARKPRQICATASEWTTVRVEDKVLAEERIRREAEHW